jgi:hypothetical protein
VRGASGEGELTPLELGRQRWNMTFIQRTWYDVYCTPLYGVYFSELPEWAQQEVKQILDERQAFHDAQRDKLLDIGQRLYPDKKD